MDNNVQVMQGMMKYAHRAFDEGYDEMSGIVIDLEILIKHLFETTAPYTHFKYWALWLDNYVSPEFGVLMRDA